MKRTTLLGLGMAAALGLCAAPLTPEQALDRLSSGKLGKIAAARLDRTPVWTARTPDGSNAAYVFNNSNGQGFRILSADDAAYAVLGYSDSGSVDPDNLSPEFLWWMQSMGDRLQYLISHGATGGQTAPAADNLAPIDPMVKSKWNQDTPFNQDCPRLGTRLTYTGCVATSMAQVMYYHKYPEKGEGKIRYQWENGTQSMFLDFSQQTYDWDNMLDVYNPAQYDKTQAAAVANLMKSCGYSVEMNYGTSASGAAGSAIADALKNYFKYDPNVSVKWRVVYSAADWNKMVYENLRDCGPIVFNGRTFSSDPTQSMGHSFVCDGYDGQGYYHFNWGWGGMSDGYYLLDCMSPDAQGIGGSDMGSSYNFALNGIFGIRKPTGEPAETVYDNLLMYGGCTATLRGSSLQFKRTSWYPDGWYNATGHLIRFEMGAIVEPVDGTAGETQAIPGYFLNANDITLSASQYYPGDAGPVVELPFAMADGRYKVTIAVKDLSVAGAPFVPVLCPYAVPNYVYVNVKNGKKSVENVPVPELEKLDLTADTELYVGRVAKFTATLKNTTGYELTENLAPALVKDGKVAMMGKNVTPSSVAPDSEGKVEWVTSLAVMQGFTTPTVPTKYNLAIVDLIDGDILATFGEVTMNPRAEAGELRCLSLVIDNCQTKTEEIGGASVSVYEVPDGADFKATLKYEVFSGFFDGILSAGIYRHSAADFNTLEPVLLGLFQQQPFLDEEEEDTVTIPVHFKDGVPGEVYSLLVAYTKEGEERLLKAVDFRVLTTGVELIGADGARARYFNLQGVEVKEPAPGQVLVRVKEGKAEKIVVK